MSSERVVSRQYGRTDGDGVADLIYFFLALLRMEVNNGVAIKVSIVFYEFFIIYQTKIHFSRSIFSFLSLFLDFFDYIQTCSRFSDDDDDEDEDVGSIEKNNSNASACN